MKIQNKQWFSPIEHIYEYLNALNSGPSIYKIRLVETQFNWNIIVEHKLNGYISYVEYNKDLIYNIANEKELNDIWDNHIVPGLFKCVQDIAKQELQVILKTLPNNKISVE